MRILQNTVKRPVAGLSFGTGGSTLVAGGSGGYDVWNLSDSTSEFIESHNVKYFWGCRCDPHGHWFCVSDSIRGFRVIALTADHTASTPGDEYENHVTSFDFSADGHRLIMNRGGGGSNRVECWTVRGPMFKPEWSLLDGKPCDPAEPYYLNQSRWFTNGLAISPDGKHLVTAESRGAGTSGNNPEVVLREGATGKLKKELGKSQTGFSSRVAIAPDNRAAFVWDEKTLERWDFRKGLVASATAPGTAYFRGVALHPAGQIVTVSGDAVRGWNASTLAPQVALKWKVGKLHSVGISPDGSLGAAGADAGQVVLWDFDI